MKLIVWLWNPGREYEKTRHNIGYMMVDILQTSWEMNDWEDSKFWALIVSSQKDKSIFIKPTTFMNLSWDAVSKIVNFYKLDPKTDILVISDDIDMEFGKVRFRSKWSHGGQNGLRDIIAKLGTDEFARIKVGIGRHELYSVSDWVLSKLTKEEEISLEKMVFPEVEKKIKEWLHT